MISGESKKLTIAIWALTITIIVSTLIESSILTILRTGLVFYFSEITKVMISRGGFNETQVKRRV